MVRRIWFIWSVLETHEVILALCYVRVLNILLYTLLLQELLSLVL